MGKAQRIGNLARVGFVGLLLFLQAPVFAQDIRLLKVTRIYIVPNGDEKETRQFEKRIPTQIGWEVTNDKAEADALLLYSLGASGRSLVYVPRGSTVGAAIPIVLKTVELYTNTTPPDLIWKFQRRGTRKIAGTAVDHIRKDMERLRKMKQD